MSNEKLRLLGHFLIAITDEQTNSLPIDNPLPIEDGLATGILTACTPIVQEIPEEGWNYIRQNIQPYSKPQPKVTRHRKLKITASSQVSQKPKEICQSSDTSVSDASPAVPISSTETLPEGSASSSASPKAVSAQISAPTKDTTEETEEYPCSSDELELWTKSPDKFLSPEGIDVKILQPCSYITAIQKSEIFDRFRLRFALRQLWLSKEAWHPLPQRLFRERVGLDYHVVPKSSYYNWLKEGKIYFLLSLEKGVGVLFSELKSREKITRLELPTAQKRSPTDSNTEADFQNKNDAKQCITKFEASEVKILGDRYEKAAKSIAEFLEALHKQAGILQCSKESRRELARSSEAKNGPTSKRTRHTIGSATDNDPLYDASEVLRRNSTPEAIDGGNSSPELQEAYVYDSAAEPKHQADMPGSPGCDIHPHGLHDQESAVQPSIESFTISNSADGPVPTLDMVHMVEFDPTLDPIWEGYWNWNLSASMFCPPGLEA